MADIVLVVITDAGSAQGFERAFRTLGVDAVVADEAESAVIALGFEKPVGVILENDLPDRPGVQLAREMRATPEGEAIPIVLLAGAMMTAEELTASAVEAGITAVLNADVDKKQLAVAMLMLNRGDAGPMQMLVDGERFDESSVERTEAGTVHGAEGTVSDEELPPNERSAAASGIPTTAVSAEDEPGIESDASTPPPSTKHRTPPVENPAGERPRAATPPASARPREESKGRIVARAKPMPAGTPRTGTLDDLPFAKLLSDLHREQATGVLDLAREKVKKSIWLRDGVPVFAKSNAMGETLGAVLVKMGKITDAQRSESMEAAQKQKRKHGDVLVEMGFIKPKDVSTALQAQARAKVINCFAWDDGSYTFTPGSDSPEDLPELKMSFGSLIIAGVKQRYDMPRLRKVMLPHIADTPRFQDSGAALLEQMKLEPEERKAIEGLTGRRSLAEILALSDMDETQLHRALVASFFVGVLRFTPEGPQTARIRLDREEQEEIRAAAETPPPRRKPGKDDDEPGERTREQTEDESAFRDETGTGTSTGVAVEATIPPSADPVVLAKVEAALARMREENHYERLSVPTDASDAAIKSSYLRLAKDFHPDRLVGDGGTGLKNKADRLFAMIAEAYQTLTDAKKRRQYDDEVILGKKSDDDASDEANAILNAEHHFLKGERLLRAGNTAKAFEAFAQAVELYPRESEYQACYGWTMWKLNHPANPGKASEAEKVLRDALKANARNDKAHLFLGQIARVKGELDEAKKHFEKALAIQPDNTDAQRELRVMEMRDSKGKGITGLFRGGKK